MKTCLIFFLQTIEKSPQADHDIALIPQNRARNRFGNIFPCKHTTLELNVHGCIQELCVFFSDNFNRVVLKDIPQEEHSDYINASYVDVCKNTRVAS